MANFRPYTLTVAEVAGDKREIGIGVVGVVLLYAALSGLLLMTWATRRVRHLSKGVAEFAAGDLTAEIQFVVSGEEPGTYHLHISTGACSFHEGEATSPSLTIKTPSEVWLAISRGEMDGQSAFMTQKYTVEGDFTLLMKLDSLFKS